MDDLDEELKRKRAWVAEQAAIEQLQYSTRMAAAKANGSFDVYAERVLAERVELLDKLVANYDEALTHD